MSNDYFNPPNSIWPNGIKVDSDGYAVFYPLGTNKVNVPTSSTQWPKGDKLVSPYVYQDNKLVGFADTKALTVSGNTAIYLPYTHIEAEFSGIEKGQLQIHAPNATTKKASWKDSGVEDIPEAQYKYKGCKSVNDVKTVDPNYQTTDIIDGVWSEPLWDSTNYTRMFENCSKITSFSSDLPNLSKGSYMFCECSNLTSFSSDLSRLKNGKYMFSGCYQLTSFYSNLSSLTDGGDMFSYCKLDASSVKNIIDTIKAYSGELTLGMGCNSTEEDVNLFAQESGYADMASLLATLQTKGWTIEAQYNGRPTTTYGLRRPSTDTLPVFVQLKETEDYADYMSEDGFKKYRLNWFHETTGSTDGYTQFNSLEEAIESLNIKPIERN